MTTFEDVRLGDLVPLAIEITRGFPTQRTVADGDLPVMSIAALRTGSPPRRFANRDDVADLKLDIARPGDILVAIEGGTIGEILVVPHGHRDVVPSQQAATLRVVDASRIDPWYLGAWLSTKGAEEQLRRLARGSGIQRIAMKDLASLTVSVPPFEHQREIGERFRAFDASIRSHRAITSCLEQLLEADLVVAFADLAAGDDEAMAPAFRGRQR
jgi:hypothetical protein